MKRVYVIYEVECLINGKIYIGLTSRTLEKRWRNHVVDAAHPGRMRALQRAIACYGSENFHVGIVEKIEDLESARQRERELIVERQSLTPHGYNLTTGGDGAIGVKQSKETREKRIATMLSLGMKRPPISDDTRARMRASHLGKKLPVDQRQKISNALKGRKPSAATIAANTGRVASDYCRERTAQANVERVWTPEMRAKLSASHTGKQQSAEAIGKTAEFNRGRKLPEEQRAKMSAARVAWWARHQLAPTSEVRERAGRP